MDRQNDKEMTVMSSQGIPLDKIYADQKDFFASGITLSYEFRIEKLEKLLNAIKANSKAILEALYKDLRKSKTESLITEIALVCEEIKHVKKNLKKWLKPIKASTPLQLLPAQSYIYHDPLGIVLIIGPWNYPFQLIMAPLIGALSAGNCVVLKPSEMASHTCEVICDLVNNIFDEKLVAVFTGGVKTSEKLLQKRWDHIFFTGSPTVGRIIYQSAAQYLTPVTLELGGKSPCIVDKDCDLKVAAKRIAWSKFTNAGQTCVAPDYLLVQSSIKAKFIDVLKDAIYSLYSKHPKDSQDFGRIINRHHFDRILKLLTEQKVIFGGESDARELFIAPTLVAEPSHGSLLMQEEIFGPILPILSFHDISDVIRLIKSKEKPLALYLYSKNKNHINKVLEELSFGGGMINDGLVHVGNINLPFGGVGQSGLGSYHGKKSFTTFSHTKSVMYNPTVIDLPFRYPPYTTLKNKLIRTLFGI